MSEAAGETEIPKPTKAVTELDSPKTGYTKSDPRSVFYLWSTGRALPISLRRSSMKPLHAIMLAAILAMTVTHAAVAAKVTIDPNNTKPTIVAAPQEKPDPRLDQKVTYTATDKRLHSVLEDISKQTSVTVYSGKTPADWQVRDLPVIVCAKDLPLGKLLRSIADATHLALTSTTVKNVKYYRIWRDAKREKQLADYFKKKSEVDLARAKWEWDGLINFAQAHNADKLQDLSIVHTRDLGKVLAALPSGTLDSVLCGRHVHLTPQNTQSPLSGCLKAICLDWWQIQRLGRDYQGDPSLAYLFDRDLNDYELATMSLDIALARRGGANLDCELQGPHRFRFSSDLRSIYRDVLLKQDGMKANEPQYPAPPCTDYAPGFVKIDLDKPANTLPDRKLRIAAPKLSEDLTYPEVVSRISDVSGFSIVLENLQGHQWRSDDLTGLPIYDRDTTLQDLLRALKRPRHTSNTDWFVDNDSRLLVGSASGVAMRGWSTGEEWWNLHRSLAPEAVISNMVTKYNGDGLQFDDILPAVLLNEDQRWEWVFRNPALFMWEPAPHTEPFWRLYAGLSPEDKPLAESPAGLPLGKLSTGVVQAAFGAAADLAEAEGLEKCLEGTLDYDPDLQKRMEEWQKQHYPEFRRIPLRVDWVQMMNDVFAEFPEVKAMSNIPTDMNAISKLRMRLIVKEHTTKMALDENYKLVEKPVPEDQRTHSYTLAIQGDGVNLRIQAPLYTFPAYSEKRKKQLEEARKKDAGKAAGAPPSQPK